MNKRLFTIILLCITLLFLAGCTSRPIQVNVSNSEELSSNQFGNFIEINKVLEYDSATRIVYFYNWNSYGGSRMPYYAPNGFPYRYNPETNTFEEINK